MPALGDIVPDTCPTRPARGRVRERSGVGGSACQKGITMNAVSEADVKDRLAAGRLVETRVQMSPVYFEGIKRILTVSADTELISAPAYYRAAQDAPSLNAYVSAMGIIQDELAHAHIGYRLMEDLGVNKEQLIYGRKPEEFKYPYAFDVP